MQGLGFSELNRTLITIHLSITRKVSFSSQKHGEECSARPHILLPLAVTHGMLEPAEGGATAAARGAAGAVPLAHEELRGLQRGAERRGAPPERSAVGRRSPRAHSCRGCSSGPLRRRGRRSYGGE